MNLCDIRDIRALLARHGFRFSKSMGQNFLIDPRVPEEIAAASGAAADCGVLEIGPGIGPLTERLCARAARVAAVELDRRLWPILEETMAGRDNFALIPGDAMKLDLRALAEERFPGLRKLVCANLPYNITTPVLTRLVEAGCFEAITVMIQREVALRIAARPGTADYGAFSAFMQYHTEPEVLFEVPPACFLPAPKVTSAVLRCRVRTAPAVAPRCGEAFLFSVIRAAFAQRRKTLLNALSAAFGDRLDREALRAALEDCRLPADIRGERLGLAEFAALADRLFAALPAGRDGAP